MQRAEEVSPKEAYLRALGYGDDVEKVVAIDLRGGRTRLTVQQDQHNTHTFEI